MKYLKTYDDKCVGCFTCETICSELYFKEDSKEKSCIEIFTLKDKSFQISVCNQCGTCVAECPTMALTTNKLGVIMVNKKLCVGCYACVAVCPTANMRTAEGLEKPFKCNACGACAKECPADSLEIVKEEK
ncbi:MAG: 4Fe-4S dicluster domain-containing protein [bacterium]|nr:4Fe-4S dicluster domain-containing protein [bacterium]